MKNYYFIFLILSYSAVYGMEQSYPKALRNLTVDLQDKHLELRNKLKEQAGIQKDLRLNITQNLLRLSDTRHKIKFKRLLNGSYFFVGFTCGFLIVALFAYLLSN